MRWLAPVSKSRFLLRALILNRLARAHSLKTCALANLNSSGDDCWVTRHAGWKKMDFDLLLSSGLTDKKKSCYTYVHEHMQWLSATIYKSWHISEMYTSNICPGKWAAKSPADHMELHPGNSKILHPLTSIFQYIRCSFRARQGGRCRARKRGRDRRMIEWGGCRRRERQSGDGKWQYNMIWFVVQNGFTVPIFLERGDGEWWEGGQRRQRWVDEVGGVWTVGP